MKTHAIRILAGLVAATLPALSGAQGAGDAPADNGTTLGSFEGVADTVDSDNLRLHTVQKKQYADGGRHELVLFPAIAQLNAKFTSHFGVGAQYLYHLHENFALQASGMFFYVNEQTEFTENLLNNAQQSPQAASALTLQWAATGGFEVTPIYGKFAWFDDTLASFGVVLSAGAGVGGTRVQVLPGGDENDPLFGDTGMKFVGQLGAGFRIRLNEDLLIRLEVRDLIYTAKVDTINGCDLEDLTTLASSEGGTIKGSCRKADLEYQTSGGQKRSAANQARDLVEDASSDVLNNIGVYGGVSYTF